jgi:EAL domain-containing protein (putative c-di-GMP-specific phosphodiesterase class I)/CheY-like chemotaxis protein
MNASSPVLLALDDDEEVVETICAIASKAGFRAVASPSPGQLQELLQSVRPDVFVLDLQMPGTDGVSALRYLADIGTKAKIFLVTGMDERTVSAAEQYGLRRGLQVMGSLQKPFDPGELLSRLEHAHAAMRPLTPADLQQGIDRRELVVYYQPIARRPDNTWDVCAVEALLRWNHPIRGLLTADSFVPMGDTHGLSRAMTDFVLQSGIEQLKGWRAAHLRIGLRVNIAAPLIADVAFPDRLEALLREHALDPNSLALEVTETGMLEQTPETLDILTRLRIKNIGLTIDDFGIGYSSLTQLFRMPFNEMKIDRSLVGKIVESKEAAVMVDALVSLAHKLGLTACAEGVEDAATLEALGRFGCDYAQGYYISEAVAPAQIPKVIQGFHLGRRQPRGA